MATYGPKFTAFGETFIYQFTRTYNDAIVEGVRKLSDAKLFDDDEAQLIGALVEQHQLRLPVIEFDKRTRDPVAPDTLPGYRSPRGVAPNQLIKYVLPVKGDMGLLKLQPSQSQMLSYNRMPEGQMLDGAIAFYIADFGAEQEVIAEAQRLLACLRQNAEQLHRELESYNAGISSTVQNAVTTEKVRRQHERKRRKDLLDQLP